MFDIHNYIKNIKYCNDLTSYSRLETREVNIGHIPLGGKNPIRIQSMTTTDTMNTIGTVEQTIRIYESGCDYVRITAPSINDAKNLRAIKDELKRRGYNIPLIADIHFTPNAAEAAARIVEKVRINPGNYADKKKFQQLEYSDEDYENEIDRIRDKVTPLINICKEYGTAMRIGTNHGSLSDRIMSRYGDTPVGMVESALEFVRICEELDFYDIVLSMKSSNPQVMVQAYRLLINQMLKEEMKYPIHLGVTEAGLGDDGRIKSSMGIGALLDDGIGDTIRVSLTEEPEEEAPVAIKLAERYKNREEHSEIMEIDRIPVNPFEYFRRESFEVLSLGGDSVPKVIADFSEIEAIRRKDLRFIGYDYLFELDKWNIKDQAADFIFTGRNKIRFSLPQNLIEISHYKIWRNLKYTESVFPAYAIEEYLLEEEPSPIANFVFLKADEIFTDLFSSIKNDKKVIFVLETDNLHGVAEQRRFLLECVLRDTENPIILKRDYKDLDLETFKVWSSTDFGSLLIDGFGDGVWTHLDNPELSKEDKYPVVNSTLFGILQAARVRISKTEYIACPSCGRTLFDLVEVTNKIRKRTEHLKGVKIGIMGCIVNGPGEMADSDYGYVGSGVGKITLYRGKEVVYKNIDSENAVDELIALIREDGKWIDSEKSP